MAFLLHTAIGMLILKLFSNNPFLALILVFISHWIIDFIPHWDLPNLSKKQKIILGGLDSTLSIILLILFIIFVYPHVYLVIGAFFLALFPDLFYIIEIFTGKKLLKRIFFDFHIKMQNEFSLGWIIELIVLIATSYFLFSSAI